MSWDLIGHEWAEKLLQEHLVRSEVRHAYLFTGATGTGRRNLAIAFACAINCLQPPSPGEYCGKCRMCIQTQKMQQTDMGIVRAENEGGMIKVEQVRNLERSLSLSPYEAKFRIALLLDFQQANANAQNALLKTLEEAPQKVILLLTADSAENLLPTISSRCEILRLRPTSVETLQEKLISRWHIEASRAALLAHLANGRVGAALRYDASPELIEARTVVLDDLLRMLPSSRRERFAYAESLYRNRDGIRIVFQTWYTWFRDLMLIVNGSEAEITNFDRKDELAQLATKVTPADALAMVQAVDRAMAALEVNGNLRLLLDTFFLDLPRID
jgi:DNA polymerase III subunit delta'